MANWRPVTGYEELYLVSDEGQIMSLERVVTSSYRTARRKPKLLKHGLRGRDSLKYAFVILSDGKTSKHLSVHRIVAEAFVPNPQNLPEVNHKDKNTLNNKADNLEWCTHEYNVEYSKNKKIAQYTADGVKIAEFKSTKNASEVTNIGRRAICNALNKWSNSAGGYMWRYCE